MSGREAARNLVEHIPEKHGYARAATWDKAGRMSQKALREIENVFLREDHQTGPEVITLTRNLYSSSARFVFELLQNADDNCFYDAPKRGELPFVAFDLHLHQSKIVVECNEDGFTRANVLAISNIGRGSKRHPQAYMDKASIGFKSVFKVAHKALIQSGDFTFSFNHNKEDSGMGMICPDWEPDVSPLRQGLTRITLSLHEDENSQKQAQEIHEQFENLQAEMLLFSRNLKKIEVRRYSREDILETTTTYQVFSTSNNRKETTIETKNRVSSTCERKIFHVTYYQTTGLPHGDTKDYAQAGIVLAFPLTEDSVPLESSQNVFAFLPVSKAGFKFVLHANFVTTDNRQDIDTTSVRNRDLIKDISAAFMEGLHQLCGHATLRYHWMRYVPKSDDSGVRGSYWNAVVEGIRSRLSDEPIALSANSRSLRLIRSLRSVPKEFEDPYGEPLFDDISPELYISDKYAPEDLEILSDLGLQPLGMGDTLYRVRRDIESLSSRLRTSTDAWQSCAARWLMLPFKRNMDLMISEVKSLKLIPLKDCTWVSSNDGPVYYPNTNGGLVIPDDIGLQLLTPAAFVNEDRKELFELLGVTFAQDGLVRERIFERYKAVFTCFLTGENSRSHLHFLYRSHHLANDYVAYKHLLIVAKNGAMWNPFFCNTYLPSEDEYGVSKLLSPAAAGTGDDDGAPGLDVPYAHEIYMQDIPERPVGDGLYWTEWLSQFVNLRTKIKLVDEKRHQLSCACLYVAKHRPSKFLGFLRSSWRAKGHPNTCDERSPLWGLRRVEVLCEDGVMRELKDTYIPTTSAKQLSARFLNQKACLPWLQLEQTPSYGTLPLEWEPLARDLKFGLVDVERETELDFCLEILKGLYLSTDSDAKESSSLPRRVYDLYLFLEAQVRGSVQKDSAAAKVRSILDGCLLYVPATTVRSAQWVRASECVWASPLVSMETTIVLKSAYLEAFPQAADDLPQLENFFKKTLNITDCNWTNIIEEIENARSSGSAGIVGVTKLYGCLNDMLLNPSEKEGLKKAFDTKPLICSFVDSPPTWHTISECLWQSAARVPGKTPLNNNNDYDCLKGFFLDLLHVPKMTIDMLYGRLKANRVFSNIEEIKEDLLEFSVLLGSTQNSLDPTPVRENRVFPVRLANGDVTLTSAQEEFAIVDRDYLADDFAGKAKFLDFDSEDVQRLRSFIQWVALEPRYLTASVKEIYTADKASAKPLSDTDQHISLKAHALLRIAVHYGSPKAKDRPAQEALYSLLRSSETLETDKFQMMLLLKQGQHTYSVEKTMIGALQFDDAEGHLRIFLPRDKTYRQLCYGIEFPRYFLDWIMDYPSIRPAYTHRKAFWVIKSVVKGRPGDLRSLELVRVPPVSVGVSDKYDEADARDFGSSTSSNLSGTITPSSPAPPPSSSGTVSQPYSDSLQAQSKWQARPHSTSSASSPPVLSTQYRGLLEKVIAAGRRAEIPSQGLFNMAQMQATLIPDVDATQDLFVLQHPDQLEHDKMIGAAGEAFVMELLSHQNLPGFGRANWQSTKRHYVNVHPDYADLERLTGFGHADIVYEDATSALTTLLSDKGYHLMAVHNMFTRTRLCYFIDVMATTGSCETPFSMSKHQYRRMQGLSQETTGYGAPFAQVYVIFRVYNLGLDSVGVRILIDPESLRQRGELSFTAENWSVTTAAAP